MKIGFANNNSIRIPLKTPCKGYYLRWYYNGWHYWFFLPGELILDTEGQNYRTIGTRKIGMSSGQVSLSQCSAIRTIMNTREVYLLTIDGWKNIRIEPGSVSIYNNEVNGYEIEIIAIIGSKEVSYITGFSPVNDIPVVPGVPDPTICEVIIGTQIWLCKNYDWLYKGSKVYDGDENNNAIYGLLYNWPSAIASGFAPPGWHLPTKDEWNIMIAYIGGSDIAGGILKEIGTTHWDAPNTGAVDSYNFTAKGGGLYSPAYGYISKNVIGFFWSNNGGVPQIKQMSYDNDDVIDIDSMPPDIENIIMDVNLYASVRLIKDSPAPYILASTSISDLILKSTDGGITFANEGSAGKGTPVCFCQLPNSDVLYGTSTGWIINHTKSTNAFTEANSIVAMIYNIAESSVETMLANGNLYRSLDNGISFDLQNTGYALTSVILYKPLGNHYIIFTDTGIYDYSNNLLQAGNFTCACDAGSGIFYSGDTSGHIWKSIDYGSTWSDLGVKGSPNSINFITKSQTRFLFSCGVNANLFYTDDNFISIYDAIIDTGGLTVVGLIIVDQSILVLGTNSYANIFISNDNGLNWDEISGNPQQGEASIDCLIRCNV